MLLPTETDQDKLKYAIVELIAEKGQADSIECGLLRGIGDNFLWTATQNKVSRTFNLDYFNILSVVTYDGTKKTYMFFMADKDEQEEAKSVVEQVYKQLKSLALPEGGTLLDVSKFVDVPTDFGRVTKSHTHTTQNTSDITSAQCQKDWTNHHSTPSRANTSSSIANDWNKEPEPYYWKRKSRKPTAKVLEKMRETILLVAKREYEYNPPTIKGEKKKVIVEPAGKNSEGQANNNAAMFAGYDDENYPFG